MINIQMDENAFFNTDNAVYLVVFWFFSPKEAILHQIFESYPTVADIHKAAATTLFEMAKDMSDKNTVSYNPAQEVLFNDLATYAINDLPNESEVPDMGWVRRTLKDSNGRKLLDVAISKVAILNNTKGEH